jgi:hypothetical protein
LGSRLQCHLGETQERAPGTKRLPEMRIIPITTGTNVELEKIARASKEVKLMNNIKKMWKSLKNILFRRKNR